MKKIVLGCFFLSLSFFANSTLIKHEYQSVVAHSNSNYVNVGDVFNWSVVFDNESLEAGLYSNYQGDLLSTYSVECPDGNYCGYFDYISEASFDLSELASLIDVRSNSTVGLDWLAGANYRSHVGGNDTEGTVVYLLSDSHSMFKEPELYGSTNFWDLEQIGNFVGSANLISVKTFEVSEPTHIFLFVLILICFAVLRSRLPATNCEKNNCLPIKL